MKEGANPVTHCPAAVACVPPLTRCSHNISHTALYCHDSHGFSASIALSPHTSKRRPAMRRVRRTCLGQPVLFCYQIWLEAGVDISA